MKKLSVFLAVALCLLLAMSIVVQAEDASVPVLTLGNTELVVYCGKPSRISYELTGAGNAKVIRTAWTSSDETVAAVNGGVVTGKTEGTAVITCTATLNDNSELSASCQVKVNIAVTMLTLGTKQITINTGESYGPVEYTVKPENATCKAVIWTTSDETVATVNENGVITALKAGKANITAESADDSTKKASIMLNVLQPVSSVTLDQTNGEIVRGKSVKLTATVLPEDASNKKLTWTTSDATVAMVTNGMVTAKGAGKAIITCTTADGSEKTAEYLAEVIAPVTAVTIEPKIVTAFVGGESVKLTAKVMPESAKYNTVTWSSSDESIATVDENGTVTPVSLGKAIITATSDDKSAGMAKAPSFSCTVTVNQAVESIRLDQTAITVAKGKTYKLAADIQPEDASNKKLIWESADQTVATVANGVVSGRKTGDTVITAVAADGSGVKTSCKVTVIQGVTSINFKQQRGAVTEDESITLSVKVSPDDATNKTVVWSSDNPSIASVDSSTGTVKGNKVGSCKITAKATDGSERFATITVFVEPEIPLDAVKFTKQGYFGLYNEFAVTFKNVTKTRTVKYVQFDVKYKYLGSEYTLDACYFNANLRPGQKKKEGWWDQIGIRLMYASDFRIYLTRVKYSDGTSDSFYNNNLIGWFF